MDFPLLEDFLLLLLLELFSRSIAFSTTISSSLLASIKSRSLSSIVESNSMLLVSSRLLVFKL